MPTENEPAPTHFTDIAAALAGPGYAVVGDFLGEEAGLALLDEIKHRRDVGDLREAAVGRGTGKLVHTEIRGDEVLWLDQASLTNAQKIYWDALEEVRATLNRELFLGLFDLEAHLARYPPGTYYRTHLDCHRGDSARTVSAILYLNRDWSPDDGGELRLYTDREAGSEGPRVDIAPEFGKFVLFLSADFWHEVLPARRERFSVTGWFCKRTGEAPV